MTWGWAKGFVIEYVGGSGKKNKRKNPSCKDCKNADLKIGCCKVMPYVFRDDGYHCWRTCKHFSPRKNVGGEIRKKAEAVLARRETLNATGTVSANRSKQDKHKSGKHSASSEIHKSEVLANRFERSRVIIRKAIKENRLKDDVRIYKDVEESNFVGLWNTKGEARQCDCGGGLRFLKDDEICFHVDNEPVYIQIPGKQCMVCKKMYIVKSMIKDVLNSIGEESCT